jgi:hypothetical protein
VIFNQNTYWYFVPKNYRNMGFREITNTFFKLVKTDKNRDLCLDTWNWNFMNQFLQ